MTLITLDTVDLPESIQLWLTRHQIVEVLGAKEALSQHAQRSHDFDDAALELAMAALNAAIDESAIEAVFDTAHLPREGVPLESFRVRPAEGPVVKSTVVKSTVVKSTVVKSTAAENAEVQNLIDEGLIDEGPIDEGPIDESPIDKSPIDEAREEESDE